MQNYKGCTLVAFASPMIWVCFAPSIYAGVPYFLSAEPTLREELALLILLSHRAFAWSLIASVATNRSTQVVALNLTRLLVLLTEVVFFPLPQFRVVELKVTPTYLTVFHILPNQVLKTLIVLNRRTQSKKAETSRVEKQPKLIGCF